MTGLEQQGGGGARLALGGEADETDDDHPVTSLTPPSRTTVLATVSHRVWRTRPTSPKTVIRRLVEAILFVQYAAAAVALELVWRQVPFTRILPQWARAARRAGRALPIGRRLVPRHRRDRLISIAANLSRPGRACLLKAFLRWWDLLADDPAVLVIGAMTKPTFAAHAWVSCDQYGEIGRGAGWHPLVEWDGAGTPCDLTDSPPDSGTLATAGQRQFLQQL